MAVRFVMLAPATLVAGTSVVLGPAATKCSSIFIEADALNTGAIYWGDSSVTSTHGFGIAPGQKESVTFDFVYGNATALTLGSLYLATATSGNVAHLGYWRVD